MISALWSQFEGQSIENSFRLTRLIGVGGFGGVFLGDHVVEGHFVRRVAVKLIESQPESFERQLGELITATTLQHPLAFLHLQKLVHRDLKPGNILRVGEAWKLSDFGTVRQSASAGTSHTRGFTGTIAYMPPESFEGTVSPAWDTPDQTDQRSRLIHCLYHLAVPHLYYCAGAVKYFHEVSPAEGRGRQTTKNDGLPHAEEQVGRPVLQRTQVGRPVPRLQTNVQTSDGGCRRRYNVAS